MIYWIWLAERLGYGNRKLKLLLSKFGTAENIYNANPLEIAKNFQLDEREVKSLSNKSLKRCENILSLCCENKVELLTFMDDRYPELLREIDNPPAVLYYKGKLPDFNNMPTISLVGTRKADEYSIKVAWSLSARLSLANFIVISGGALGIDSAAHKGTLDTDGITVALLASGINYPYLKSNEDLRNKITEKGCLISEFPPNYPLKKYAFHLRNRLISGLSLGTVIIEAGEKSGALITAKNANEQGRDVFVITGKPDDKKYMGSYSLLKDGAIPVFEISDITNEYMHLFGNIIDINKASDFDLKSLYRSKCSGVNPKSQPIKETKNEEPKKIFSEISNFALSKNAEIVYNSINIDFFTIDDFADCGLSVADLFSAVTELELADLIKAVPGGRYKKTY